MSPFAESITRPFALLDCVAGAVVAALIVLLVRWRVRAWADRGVLMLALAAKLASTVAYDSYTTFLYRGGDTFLYHAAGVQFALSIAGWITGAPRSIDVAGCYEVPLSSTALTCAASGVVHLITFGSFIGASFLFGLIGFIGQVVLYRFFSTALPGPSLRTGWQAAMLFLPSLTLWSAGLTKEPLRLLALAALLAASHTFLVTHHYRALLVAGCSFLFMLDLYPAAAAVLLVASCTWAALSVVYQSWRGGWYVVTERAARKVALPVLLIGIWIGWATANGGAIPELGATLDQLPNALIGQRGKYSTHAPAAAATSPTAATAPAGSAARPPCSASGASSAAPTWLCVLEAWPSAITTVLFRPFLWEAAGATQLLAALENGLLLIMTMRALAISALRPATIAKAWRSQLLPACAIFVALFSLGVGVSTPNLGTLSRYRIVMLPFLLALLVGVEQLRRVRIDENREETSADRQRAIASPYQTYAPNEGARAP